MKKEWFFLIEGHGLFAPRQLRTMLSALFTLCWQLQAQSRGEKWVGTYTSVGATAFDGRLGTSVWRLKMLPIRFIWFNIKYDRYIAPLNNLTWANTGWFNILNTMPSPRMKIYKRSPASHSSCKSSPTDVLVRTGKGSSLATFPEQKVLPRKRKDSSDFPKTWRWSGKQIFIWHKKIKKEEKEKLPLQLLKKCQKRKAEENARELEELKRRRKEREKIRHEVREVREKEERKRAAEQKLAEEQEESFFLNQVPLRSQIRLEQGRAQPIDLLARYVTSVNQLNIENIETEDPLHIVDYLPEQDLGDLVEDIKVYKRVHLRPDYQCFWNTMEQIANFMLRYSGSSSQRKLHPLNSRIEDEIASILNGKTIRFN